MVDRESAVQSYRTSAVEYLCAKEMNSLLIAAALIAIGIVIFLAVRNRKKDSTVKREGSLESKTLEDKLAALESCGITLRAEFSVDDLLSSWGRADYEEPGYNLVLVGVGMTQEKPPWKHRSDNLWHFDTECIEDHGAYTDIAKRMVELAGGSLPLTDIEDYVEIEEEKAWVSFKLDGDPIRIICEVDNDWVDPKVFGHFVRLLTKKDSSRIYFYVNLGGQDCIIGCLDRENYKKLRKIIPAVEPLT